MDERDQRATGARPRLLVDQLGALRAQVLEGVGHVRHAVRDVVHALAALGEVPADRRLGAERAQELDVRRPGREQHLLDPLVDQLLALVGNTIGAVTDPLLALLGGLLTPLLGALNLQVTNLVDDLIAGVQRATSVLRIQLGTSAAESVTTPGAVTATAVAEGAQIDVLPGLTLGGAPLLTIIVGGILLCASPPPAAACVWIFRRFG